MIDTNIDTTNFIESSLSNIKSTEIYKSSIPIVTNSTILELNAIESSLLSIKSTEIYESSIPIVPNSTSNTNISNSTSKTNMDSTNINQPSISNIISTTEINESNKSNMVSSTSKINIDSTNNNKPSISNITSTIEINESNYKSIIITEHTVHKTDFKYNATDTEKDTTNLFESNLPKINISNSTLNTIFKTTIPTIISKKTTLPSPISSIPNIKTTELIKVTIPSPINTTSIITNNPKIPKTNIYENTNAVQFYLLGFSNLEMLNSSFSFSIYLVQIDNLIIIYPPSLNFPIIVTYATNLRSLEEIEAKCYLNNLTIGSKIQYICEVEADISNIKQIKIEPKFNFVPPGNFSIIVLSPLAKQFIHNPQLVDERYDQILYQEIYILDISTYYQYNKKEFNISGSIKDPQPKLKKNELPLMINSKDSTIDANCIINNSTRSDYYLYCEVNELLEILEIDLEAAIGKPDNETILMTHLKPDFESKIIDDSQNKSLHISKAKTSKGENTSLIAILISIIIFIAIAITFIVIICFKKINKKTKKETLRANELTFKYFLNK